MATDPPEKMRDAILQAEHGLRFLILLVPDPNQTSMSHEFDPTLSAALRATESAGLLARHWSPMPGFPLTKKDAAQNGSNPAPGPDKETPSGTSADLSDEKKSPSTGPKWPAAVLSIPTDNSDCDPSIRLLTLLVPESPTWGVDQDRLASAIDLITSTVAFMRSATDPIVAIMSPVIPQPIRIIGPAFSGSIDSLAEVLKYRISRTPRPRRLPSFIIYNGRSVSPNLEPLKFFDRGCDPFQVNSLYQYGDGKGVPAIPHEPTPFFAAHPRFAVLLESNTALGQAARQAITKDTRPTTDASAKTRQRAESTFRSR